RRPPRQFRPAARRPSPPRPAHRPRTFRARVWRGYREEGAFARTRREHAAIHRALVARDPEAARAAAAAHVGEVEEWLRAQLGP
ncbi:FCD domain-containing protein, partial [Streptomyces sp. NPDC047072]|uniref:FCD domain-containing protein n=1 Tax=Streptomyces sp. NPDC047072 TaxID=3154809 RepID=UPI0033CC9C05